MTNGQWKSFFEVCRAVLGKGEASELFSESWCSWTTYERLNMDARYWAAGMPNEDEILAAGIKDGGTWGQPFRFQEIAHVIIPRKFYWESVGGAGFQSGYRRQDIEALSNALAAKNVPHRLSELILEVKCY